MSFQSFIDNHTPFVAEQYVLPDKSGQEVVLVVVSATFIADGKGALKLADEQLPLHEVDQHRADPNATSIIYENDLALEKPFVDVLLNAHAYAPGGKPVTVTNIKISIGDIQKELIVSGDRQWLAFGMSASKPEVFHEMPIIWERAFGGVDNGPSSPSADLRNLIGVGYHGAVSQHPDIQTEIPNIEYPGSRQRSRRDVIEPAGLAGLTRGWKPRVDFAGTYDDTWLQQRWPLLPVDFDARFNQSAPIDQQSRAIVGGEAAELLNLTHDGLWRFHIPRIDVPVRLFYDDRQTETSLHFDTIMIEPDVRRVTIKARTVIRSERNKGALREIVLGHVTRAWLRAKVARKLYVDQKGTSGTDDRRRSYY